MGGGEPETEEDSLSPSLAALKLVDSPILFLAVFHKVLRSELAQLRRLAVEAVSGNGSLGLDLVDELRRRFQFLKLVCKYHCAAEDEVIFLALDAHVKNVVCTYSLEHRSIDDMFVSIFHYLDLLKKESENLLNLFKELIICIGTLWTIMSQHMLKEEEQIFPLLVQQFSPKEQAKLVWQYLCSVPIILLEEFLPWLTTTLSSDQKNDFLECISVIVPDEKLLQEVVIYWLESNKSCHFEAHNKYGKGAQIYYGPANFKDMLKLYPPKIHSSENQLKGTYLCQQTSTHGPIDGISLWHAAIRRNFKEILAELHQLQNSSSIMTLSSLVIQLKFFVDILAFYSYALDKLFYPLLEEIAETGLSPFYEHLIHESQIEGLTKLLFSKLEEGLQSNFIEMLCQELESVAGLINKRLIILEKEVISLISETCSHELQIWLLYSSLHMMPLGLLKCMVTWFSSHLSEDEYKAILNKIKMGNSAMHGPFASLLSEWIRTGCSGKISIEKFVEDLEELFSSRSYFCSELTMENSGNSCSQLYKQPSNKCSAVQLGANSTMKANHNVCNTLTMIDNVSYSNGISLHMFFSDTLKKLSSLPETVECSSSCTSVNLDLRPMDCFYLFHKALKKDLDYLVFLSGKLGEDVGILTDFERRFRLVMFLFQNHSNSEDEVAFPALESKGKLQNISHSYAIDHRFEAEQFNKISLVLDEIFKLQLQVDKLDQRMLKYSQLCLKLHSACISMCKVLSDHMHREEVELWPLFSEYFSIKEQEKILGHMLGKTKAEILQEMIPWLMESLTEEEQHAMMSLWRKATKNTKFEEWLGEWWEGIKEYRTPKIEHRPNASHPLDIDPLEVVSTYLMKGRIELQEVGSNKDTELQKDGYSDSEINTLGFISTNETQVSNKNQSSYQSQEVVKLASKIEKNRDSKTFDCTTQNNRVSHIASESHKLKVEDGSLVISQEELLTVIRRVSNDSSLDSKKKQYIMQSLLMSQWIVTQKKSHSVAVATNEKEEALGLSPAYQDSQNLIFGCKHYKRNCKLLAPCCNKLYTCIRCHDELTDHSLDRRTITEMMCMKCLLIQPIGPNCSTPTCNKLSMARYYCRICKLFDDAKQIYHCPYCNLCRVGKGLGIDYFHCMNCNACMSRSLSVHVCREKCFEDNCPICHEYIFTSTSPVKALPCGHVMHSACFQDYTCTHYICPICSKSLGDMQVYFKMLDTLLAEEKIPEEYAGQTQAILRNDCEKRGTASFHWLYHKCSHCGSYNTRLI
nr:zinc finger protein BRUTUS-like At1g74770 [Ipomoea batatas]